MCQKSAMWVQKAIRLHPPDILCNTLHITHKTIRPETPWHNSKVERSHRNDRERFYNHLRFYSYEDLQLQMKLYLSRSNRIPMSVLDWKSPIQKRQKIEVRPVFLAPVGLRPPSVTKTDLLRLNAISFLQPLFSLP